MSLSRNIIQILSFFPLIFIVSYFLIDFSTFFQKQFFSNMQISSTIQTQKQFSHIGQIDKFNIIDSNQLKSQPFHVLNFFQKLSVNKKIDQYIFTHYNWYRFELNFIDLQYDSYFQFRLITQKSGVIQFSQKVGFSLQQYFNSKNYNQNFKINFEGDGNLFKMKVNQFVVNQMSNNEHDGYSFQALNLYSQNSQTNQEEVDIFLKSKKTVTNFNITYERSDLKLQLNLTHILRHDQCLTSYDHSFNVLRHKCMGGYGFGRVQMDKFQFDNLNESNKQVDQYGNWSKDVFNIKKAVTRTIFKSMRSTRDNFYHINNWNLNNILPQTNWKWYQLNIDFNGFCKLQYYKKKDNIQKQRWIGMSIFKNFLNIHDYQEQYIFINGKIVPIHQLQYSFSMKNLLSKQQKIIFKSRQIQSEQDIKSLKDIQVGEAYVFIQFSVFQLNQIEIVQFGKTYKKTYMDGFWSGSVYVQIPQTNRSKYSKVQIASFYNITGSIQLLKGIF